MLVHFPIALVVLWPLLDMGGLFANRPDVSKAGVGVLLAALVFALAATLTGQAAYDVAVPAGHAPALLDSHASDADLVPWLLLAIVVLRLGGVRKFGRSAQIAAIVCGLVLALFVFQVGEAGGDLVFEHGVGVKVTSGDVTP